MKIIDSCGWLEYFADGPNADFFAAHLLNYKKLIVPSLTVFEVFKKLLQSCPEEQALELIAQMQQGKVVPLTDDIAISAAKLSHDHKIPMADSIIYATAKHYNATLYTQDDDFAGFEDVKYKKKK